MGSLKHFTLGLIGGTLAILAGVGVGNAAIVRGTVLNKQGQPLSHLALHLESRVSHDSFLGLTGADGSFAIDVPPGYYQLRDSDGTIISPNIVTTHDAEVALGKLVRPGFPWPLLEQQVVAPAILKSPAPITAYVRPGGPIAPAQRSAR
jgi:hypothetical protein